MSIKIETIPNRLDLRVNVELPPDFSGVLLFDNSISEAYPDVWEEWLRLRKDYVAGQGWGEDLDPDKYDEAASARTVHALLFSDGKIVGGVRATLVKVSDALSLGMLGEDARREASGQLQDTEEEIWDVTRLIAPNLSGLGLIISELVEYTTKSEEGNRSWVCVTSRGVAEVYRRKGESVQILYKEDNKPPNRGETVICRIDSSRHESKIVG